MKNKIFKLIFIFMIIITYIIILNNYKYYKSNIIKEEIKEESNSSIALYQQIEGCTDKTSDACYSKIDRIPSGEEYIINQDKSYCSLTGSKDNIDHDAIIKTNNNGEHVIGNMQKEEKCYLWFEKAPEKGITIIAKLGEEVVNFPTKGSGTNPKSITCTNDVEAKFDYNNWELEIDAIEEGATTCTVEFQNDINKPFNEYLRDNADALGLVNENGLRYEGAEVNNYVLFNNELWRIIGVFNVDTESSGEQELVKLIRAQALDGLALTIEDNNIWEGSSLQETLNSGYLNKENVECNINQSIIKTCNFSKTGINDEARSKIESVKWNVGASTNDATVEEAYNDEIVTQTNNYYKVGLMSASDYGYGVTQDSCDRKLLAGYGTSLCAGSNWLKNIGYEWTLTPYSLSTINMLTIDIFGYVFHGEHAVIEFNFRPSIYLKPDVLILGGSGTHDLPYVLN